MAMSTAPPRQRSIEDEDESVRIAVRALGDMRNRAVAGSSAGGSHPASSFQPTPALSTVSTSTSPTLASPSLVAEDVPADMDAEELDADFVSRVSHLPLVTTALRAYEQSKASSRVVKYGAEMMESSMKAVSRPVIDRLPVGQLDEFACRQLDRLGRYGGARPVQEEDEQPDRGWESGLQMRDESMTRTGTQEDGVEGGDTVMTPVQSPRTQTQRENEQQQQVVQRSRWQAVLLEAGGIGAAVSEESMRRLKYCLQWLQYATAHIDGQIVVLRKFMDALQPPPGSSSPINPEAIISPEHLRQLTNAKRDVVDTIRQVVDVVSKYAGSALPEPARSRVRGFILQLPQAWASAARRQGQQDVQNAAAGSAGSTRGRGTRRSARARAGDRVSGELSRPTSPSNHSRASSVGHGGVPPTAGAAAQAAQRILTLATESLDMMRGVTGVVKDSLDRADAWVDRLRVVGLQRQGVGADGHERLPPPVDLMTHRAPMGSTNTSVASSPVMHSTVLPPLRTPEALSPRVHTSGGESYFPHTPASGSGSGVGLGITTPASAPTTSIGFGKLNLGEGNTTAVNASGSVTPVSAKPGKKGMFAEEGEGGTGLVRRAITPRTVDDGGTKMDVDT